MSFHHSTEARDQTSGINVYRASSVQSNKVWETGFVAVFNSFIPIFFPKSIVPVVSFEGVRLNFTLGVVRVLGT